MTDYTFSLTQHKFYIFTPMSVIYTTMLRLSSVPRESFKDQQLSTAFFSL